MKVIKLKNFGHVLISTSDGLESFKAIRPQLSPTEPVGIDFADVLTVTPSWLDEFLTNLTDFNGGMVELLPTNNASVLASLPVLAAARQDFVADVVTKLIKTSS